MIKKLNKQDEDRLDELNEKKPSFVRLAIYPQGTKSNSPLTYRNEPCAVLPDETGKFYTNSPDSKSEYNTQDYRVRWGRCRYLKRNGRAILN